MPFSRQLSKAPMQVINYDYMGFRKNKFLNASYDPQAPTPIRPPLPPNYSKLLQSHNTI